MRTRLVVGLLVGGLLAAMLPGVATAAKPERGWVTIRSPMVVNYPAPNTGTFTATGKILCPAGTVLDTYLRGYGRKRIYVEKTFTCDDGSGTFDVVLRARRKQNGTERLRWRITGGTGDYVGLWGRGGGRTTPKVVNIYKGRVVLR